MRSHAASTSAPPSGLTIRPTAPSPCAPASGTKSVAAAARPSRGAIGRKGAPWSTAVPLGSRTCACISCFESSATSAAERLATSFSESTTTVRAMCDGSPRTATSRKVSGSGKGAKTLAGKSLCSPSRPHKFSTPGTGTMSRTRPPRWPLSKKGGTKGWPSSRARPRVHDSATGTRGCASSVPMPCTAETIGVSGGASSTGSPERSRAAGASALKGKSSSSDTTSLGSHFVACANDAVTARAAPAGSSLAL
mmetsp:Transcript_45744/g.148712  ORF Transcript_45744/g.148712 Transcript_45744/m.148712 type:complete len:251 (+) Transcript_45744:350-1102(+)